MSRYNRKYTRIIVSLENVDFEDQAQLVEYLEDNCWDWTEEEVVRPMKP